MKDVDIHEPSFLPDLTRSSALIVASDFSGDHGDSPYQTLTFVITSAEAIAEWDLYRRQLRQDYRLRRRRLAYSKLTDRRKRAASAPFLYLANAMSGLAVTTLIDKRIDSLFLKRGLLVPGDIDIGDLQFQAWKPVAFERMLRAAHLIAVFVAGLSSSMQNIFWVTDEDEIAPNVPRLKEVNAHICPCSRRHAVA